MKNQVYKHIELTGTSPKSIEDAVNTALKRAGQKAGHTRERRRWQGQICTGRHPPESEASVLRRGRSCQSSILGNATSRTH